MNQVDLLISFFSDLLNLTQQSAVNFRTFAVLI